MTAFRNFVLARVRLRNLWAPNIETPNMFFKIQVWHGMFVLPPRLSRLPLAGPVIQSTCFNYRIEPAQRIATNDDGGQMGFTQFHRTILDVAFGSENQYGTWCTNEYCRMDYIVAQSRRPRDNTTSRMCGVRGLLCFAPTLL